MNSDHDIIEHCARAGLELSAVSWRDDLLLLHPSSAADLPQPEQLAALGAALKARTGARWVALDVDVATEST